MLPMLRDYALKAEFAGVLKDGRYISATRCSLNRIPGSLPQQMLESALALFQGLGPLVYAKLEQVEGIEENTIVTCLPLEFPRVSGAQV
jgi:hypothetical protein